MKPLNDDPFSNIYHPLTKVQQSIYFEHLLNSDIPALNLNAYFSLNGTLNSTTLEKAIQQVIKENQALRTSIHMIDDEPFQSFEIHFPPYTYIDMTKEDDPEATSFQAIQSIASSIFELYNTPLVEFYLYKISETKHYLLLKSHHLVQDGYSYYIVMHQLNRIYNELCNNDYHFEELNPYVNFIEQEQLQYESKKFKQAVDFWKDQWEKPIPQQFPVIDQHTETRNSEYSVIQIKREELTKVDTILNEINCTHFHLYIALFNIAVYHITQQEEQSVALPFLNRKNQQMRNTAGLFISMIPFRNTITPSETLREQIIDIKSKLYQAYRKMGLPLSVLNAELKFPPSFNWFEYSLSYQQNAFPDHLGESKMQLHYIPKTHNYIPLDVQIHDFSDDPYIRFYFEYCPASISKTQIHQIQTVIQTHLNDISKLIDAPIEQFVNPLKTKQMTQLMQLSKGQKIPLPQDISLTDLIEQTASQHPNHTALVFNHQSLSFQELLNRSYALANHLLSHHSLSSEDRVGISLDRSEQFIISILGVLFAGCAYVPIDKALPESRKRYMVEDSGCKLLITIEPMDSVPSIAPADIDSTQTGKPNITVFPNQLAYIIYTSGSTGKPKGVMVEHQSILNLLTYYREHFEITKQDVFLSMASFSFDTSVVEILLPLCSGNKQVLTDSTITQDLPHLTELLNEHAITVAAFSPSLLSELDLNVSSLRMIASGGEAAVISDALKYANRYEYVNAYGPTETTISAIIYTVDPNKFYTSIPIGRPIANTEVYVLDTDLNPVPIGDKGELYIGGVGVARGYINKPKLTAERFINNPFGDGRLYKTGDLVSWLPDGNLDFHGRIDHQVKVRGYRIELGEIETVYQTQPNLTHVAVITKTAGNTSDLICYYQSDTQVSPEALRSYGINLLPDYMVPSYFIQLPEFPFTHSGKIDRQVLSQYDISITADQYTAPQTDTQKIICNAYEEVLGLDKVGIHDNFFKIGGDSIKAIQVNNRLLKHDLKTSFKNLIAHPTASDLSHIIQSLDIVAQQTCGVGEFQLSPISKWFMEYQPDSIHDFNQSLFIRFHTAVDIDQLQTAMHQLYHHHDVLRSRYDVHKNLHIVPAVSEYTFPEIHVQELDLSIASAHETMIDIANTSCRSFNIENGNLASWILFRCNDGDILFTGFHHLIEDGVSLRIILSDLFEYYEGRIPAPVITSFKTWVEKLSTYANSDRIKPEVPYWQSVLTQATGRLCDISPSGAKIFDLSQQTHCLSPELTMDLLSTCHHAYHTDIKDLLLTGLYRALNSVKGGSAYRVSFEGHGREELFEDVDISRTVGWFTTTYPVVLSSNASGIREQIIDIKHTLRSIPNSGIGYSLLRTLSDIDLPMIQEELLFNYMGVFEHDEAKSQLYPLSGVRNIGDQFRTYIPLEINAMVTDGILSVNLSYHTDKVSDLEAKALLQAFETAIDEVVHHCKQQSEEYTFDDFIYPFQSRHALDTFYEAHQISPKDICQIYPLSPLQGGFYFHWQSDKESTAYFEQNKFDIEGVFDLQLFKGCWQTLSERHRTLRGRYLQLEDGNIVQVIIKEQILPVNYIDISDNIDTERQLSIIHKTALEDKANGFNLATGPLFRITVIKTSDITHTILISCHHIIIDGWSNGILLKEFFMLYSSMLSGQTIQLQNIPNNDQYYRWLTTRDKDASLSYWTSYLEDVTEPTLFPEDIRTNQQRKTDKYNFYLNPKITAKIQEYGAINGITLSNFIESIWGFILCKLTNRNISVFGKVVSGRPDDLLGADTLTGLFINTVPQKISILNSSFKEMLLLNRDQNAAGMVHHYIPLNEIQSVSPLGRALIQSLFVFENYPLDEELTNVSDQFKVSNFTGVQETNYDLNVTVFPGKELNISFEYDSNRYSDELMSSMEYWFQHFIEQVLLDDQQYISDISLLSFDQQQQVLQLGKGDYLSVPDAPITKLIEQAAHRSPEKIAVVFDDRSLTYRELLEKAYAVANHLQNHYDLSPEDRIGISLDRSEKLIISILGVLFAGCAYVPIDKALPENRKQYMVKDSSCKLLITAEPMQSTPSITPNNIDYTQISKPDVNIAPHQLMYIIYTSGSTGKPKGVMIEHRSAVNFIHAGIQGYGIQNDDVILNFSSTSFDASIEEIFIPLLSENTLVLISEITLKNPDSFYTYILEKNVTVLPITPSYLAAIDALTPQLRTIITGGEAAVLSDAASYSKHIKFINSYGPTEATVCVTTHTVSPDTSYHRIPIGRPLANTEVYILNQHLTPVPIGVKGELYISGAGVARGYMNNPELTAKCFIDNPFGNGRIYKTGDLVSWLPDGNIDFHGRIDQQVKVRGHRIELGEIESVYQSYTNIVHVAVLTKLIGNTSDLICYYHSNIDISADDLRSYGVDHLPEYMIPSHFIHLTELPFTHSGKVDRQALAAYDMTIEPDCYIAPNTETEKTICNIYEEVLGIDKVGVYDNFFKIGGHSIHALKILSLLKRHFSSDIKFNYIFDYPTPYSLAIELDRITFAALPDILPTGKKRIMISDAQYRLWIFYKMNPQTSAYNMPGIFKIIGDINIDYLQESFDALIMRHDVFRTAFEEENEAVYQIVSPDLPNYFTYRDDRYTTETEIQKRIQAECFRGFDISSGETIRVSVSRTNDNEYYLLINISHIAGDGWSMEIISRELSEYYNQRLAGVKTTFPHQKINYRDYTSWYSGLFQSDPMNESRTFWHQMYQNGIPTLNLPYKDQRPKVVTNAGTHKTILYPQSSYAQLTALSKKMRITPFILLYGLLKILLYRYSGSKQIVLGVPSSGRIHPQLEDQVGFYVNTLAILDEVKPEMPFDQWILSIKDQVLSAFAHERYPFNKLVKDLTAGSDQSRHPLFDIMFAYDNTEEWALSLSNMEINPYPLQFEGSKFDLTVTCEDNESGLYIDINFNTDLFEPDFINQLFDHYIYLLDSIPQTYNKLLKELPIAKHSHLLKLGKEKTLIVPNVPLTELIENAAHQHPDHIAVIFNETSLTYTELLEKSYALANHLLNQYQLSPEDRIGISLDRSEKVVVSILGVLFSGCAYVPIDDNLPENRKTYMITDSMCKAVISDQQDYNVPCVDLEHVDWHQTPKPNCPVLPHQLAYVLYTSGSTGKPKGVMIEHRSIVNLITDHQSCFSVTSSDNSMGFASFSFDVSVAELFISLPFGATYTIVDDKLKQDPLKLMQYLKTNNITIADLPPSYLSEIDLDIPSLRILFTGGEPAIASDFYKYSEKYVYVNAYGPTECCVNSLLFTTTVKDKRYKNIPIGRPIANTEVYILDTDLNPVPIGVKGELHIGGIGVARGYINKPELTAERFINNPFGKGRLYKTGDLVSWLPDGNIDFHGRIDQQVKVRGYRIELGEIETVYQTQPDLTHVAVITKTAGNTSDLICYYQSDTQVSSEILRKYGMNLLPDYMVPSFFIQLPVFPFTHSGKIDRQALSQYDISITTDEYTPPQTDTQKIICNVYAEVLGLDRVGIHDNFFKIGGDSIKAIQVNNRLLKHDLKTSFKNLIAHPTASDLSHIIQSLNIAAKKTSGIGEFQFSPISKWFIENQPESLNDFNQSLFIHFDTAVNAHQLQSAIHQLYGHHDILRSQYDISRNVHIVPELSKYIVPELHQKELDLPIASSHETIVAIANTFCRTFNIEEGRLAAWILFKCADGDLLFTGFHHLIVDGVSLRIILTDLLELYHGRTPAPVMTSFKSWVEKLSAYADSDLIKPEIPYWESVLTQETEQLCDVTSSNVQLSNLSYQIQNLSPELTKDLLSSCHHAYHTDIKDLLMTSLYRALNKLKGGSAYRISFEGHGREELFDDVDISRTVGWFTTTYPVVLSSNASHIREQIIDIKHTLRSIPYNGIGYSVLKCLSNVDFPNAQEELLFNYMGVFKHNEDNILLYPLEGVKNFGDQFRSYIPLEINAMVTDGILSIHLSYHIDKVSDGEAKALLKAFASAIDEVTTHCKYQQSEYTFDDFLYPFGSRYEFDTFYKTHDIPPKDICQIYPLSPLQGGLYFHWESNKESMAYFEQIQFGIEGLFNFNVFQESWQELFDRHHTLRGRYLQLPDGEIVQVVMKEQIVPVNNIDISNQTDSDQISKTIDLIALEDRTNGFDLATGPLFRITVIKTSSTSHTILISCHHIIIDGWSNGILLKEFFHLYASKLSGKTIQLQNIPNNDRYYRWLTNRDKDASLAYWTSYLSNLTEPTIVPSNIQPNQQRKSKEYSFLISAQVTENIHRYSVTNGITLSNLIESIWGIILCKLTNNNLSVFGKVVSGRPDTLVGSESLIGLFINTVPQKTNIFGCSLKEVLLLNKNQMATGMDHHYVPLNEIQNVSPLGRELIQSLFVFENYPLDKEFTNVSELFKVSLVSSVEETNYDLNIAVFPGKELIISFGYNNSRYADKLILSIENWFLNLIEQILLNDQQMISEVSLLSVDQQQQLLQLGKGEQLSVPNISITELIEQTANRSPEKIAVVFDDRSLTYRELLEKAYAVANHLHAHYDFSPEDRVGISLDRSEKFIISILGVLFAGCAYVPIDKALPENRKQYMVKDSGCKLIITTKPINGILSITPSDIDNTQISKLNITVRPNQLAYIIYTSGSTGKPKGVMVEHQSVLNLLTYYRKHFEITEQDVFLSVSSFSFDTSVVEIMLPLYSGNKQVITNSTITQDPSLLTELLNKHEITVAAFSPSLLSELDLNIPSLRMIASGGEAAVISDAIKYAERYQYVNAYGPTETTISAITYHVAPNKTYNNIPIGRPIANSEVYILDTNLNLMPMGIKGELYIGGAGVSRGYINKSELTAERFINNPFGEGKLYKTGDLVSWLPDGNLDFHGRIDHQVKVRGYRIELGEIESIYQAHTDITHVAVIAKSTGSTSTLICYYHSDVEISADDMRTYGINQLPDYMVPAYFIQLAEFPFTHSDKIDREALAVMDLSITPDEYVSPKTEPERIICEIYAKTLHLDKVGILDDFFKVGGNSISALKLIPLINRTLMVELRIKHLFEHSTPKRLAEFIQNYSSSKLPEIQPIVTETYPLSHAQLRLWTLYQINEDFSAYHMPGAFRLKGQLNVSALNSAIATLIQRHEILRTAYKTLNGVTEQVILTSPPSCFTYHQNNRLTPEQIQKELLKEFDLPNGEVIRISLHEQDINDHILLINISHIVGDGWSMNILSDELVRYYTAFYQNSPLSLPELPIQYKDYTLWHKQILDSDIGAKSKAFWLDMYKDGIPKRTLPYDHEIPPVMTYNGQTHQYPVSKDMTSKLQDVANILNITPFMLLFGVINILLHKISGQTDMVVGVPSSGRIHPSLHNQIGFYVNTLAIKSQIQSNLSFSDWMTKVKTTILSSYDHELYPFDMLVDELKAGIDRSKHPLFDVMFSYQQPEEFSLNLPDIDDTEALDIEHEGSKFDLTIECTNMDNTLLLHINYNTDLFKSTTIDRIANGFEILLTSILTSPNTMIDELSIISSEEYKRLESFSKPDKSINFPTKSLPECFENTVFQYPKNIALRLFNQNLTYLTLLHRANAVANHLLTHYHLESEDRIAISLNRSESMIISILGILAAGCAYVPIDKSLPNERKIYMLKDSGSKLMITDEALSEIPTLDLSVIDYSKINKPNIVIKPEQLAYIIYTSGSTGKPKGVMIEHRSLVQFSYAQINNLNITENDNTLNFYSTSFDASVAEIFTSLLTGSILVLIDDQTLKNPDQFLIYLLKQEISILPISPAYLSQIEISSPHLRIIATGGEAAVVDSALHHSKHVDFINAYGPTEATVCATTYKVSPHQQYHSIPIGRPLGNSKVYILDKKLRQVPVGIKGEIYIGGSGVARGYINKPELTNECFINNPFNNEERLYKTGDIGRWMDSGNIEFFGRIDNQVQIRGHRVEPDEIEKTIISHPKLQQAAVIPIKNQNTTELFCFYSSFSQLSVDSLKNWLESHLPSYMIPYSFMMLDSLPLNISGKIDKKALKQIERSQSQSTIVPPRNELEEWLCQLYKDTLKIEHVSIDDNFFTIGGTSINAPKIISEINQTHELLFRDFFQLKTVANIAKYLTKSHKIELHHAFIQNNKQQRVFILPDSFAIGFDLKTIEKIAKDTNTNIIYLNPTSKMNKIDHFNQQLKEFDIHQNDLLVGHSAGGQLAYQMAILLCKKNINLKHIILMDSYPYWSDEFKNDARMQITDTGIRDNKFSYLSELNACFDHTIINSHIHILRSEVTTTNYLKSHWEKLTTGNCLEYQGVGSHTGIIKLLADNFKVIAEAIFPNIW